MIDNSTKEQITAQLNKYCENAGSANKASAQLGISNATISNMQTGKWESMSDDIWRKMGKALKFDLNDVWCHADTDPYLAFAGIFNDARKYANVYGVTCKPGSGKSYTIDRFRQSKPNVWYAKCIKHTSHSQLLQEILRSAGRVSVDKSIAHLLEMLDYIASRRERPVILIDEIEKVKNETMLLIIDLYNRLEGKCGIVLIGTPNLKNRVETAIRYQKIGFNELYSRIGGRFIDVPAPTKKDGVAVIRANGFSGQFEINTILNDSQVDNSIDLRRVERLVHKEKLLASPQPLSEGDGVLKGGVI
jgi:DNA transposition AAA+ family ATPase